LISFCFLHCHPSIIIFFFLKKKFYLRESLQKKKLNFQPICAEIDISILYIKKKKLFILERLLLSVPCFWNDKTYFIWERMAWGVKGEGWWWEIKKEMK
jgi:hypothetical protein